MGHAVKGLIAEPGTLQVFASRHSLHPPIALSGDLAILPLRDVDLDSFPFPPFSGNREGADFLSDQFIDVLRAASRGGALIYFETDYFGGYGAQAAAVFQDGTLVFGPESAEFGPINMALQLLGVCVEPPAVDEFDTVGLGRCRHTEDWLELRGIGGA